MNEIILILKAILPEVEAILIPELKPKAVEWLNTKIEDVKSNIAKEKICILHATFMHGLLKDEAKLVVFEAELIGLQWALDKVNSFEVETPTETPNT